MRTREARACCIRIERHPEMAGANERGMAVKAAALAALVLALTAMGSQTRLFQ
jgi:hypothetical protein